jgi:hypothetical protein
LLRERVSAAPPASPLERGADCFRVTGKTLVLADQAKKSIARMEYEMGQLLGEKFPAFGIGASWCLRREH